MDALIFVNALFWLVSASCAGFMVYGGWLAMSCACGSSPLEASYGRPSC